MESNLRTLGGQEARLVLSLQEQGQDRLTAAEAIAMLGSEPRARKVLHNLVRKGWLSRLKGGRYMLLPAERGPENLGEQNPMALAGAVVEPSYIGWWSAAAFHGFTPQQPASIIVATLKQQPARTLEGTDIRFVTLAERKFFGFESYEVYGRQVTISTPEKTLVDCLDHPDLAGGAAELARIVFGASTELEPEEVADVAFRLGSDATLKRLGFFMDLVGWAYPTLLRRRLLAHIPRSSRTTIGRAQKCEGDIGYVPEWGVIVHATESDLLADVPRRRQAS